MANLKKYLLIGGAYLCVAGNAVAAHELHFTHSKEFNLAKVGFSIATADAKFCEGTLTLPTYPKAVNCKKLEELKYPTTLTISFHDEDDYMLVCPIQHHTYKPNTDIKVKLIKNKKQPGYTCKIS